MDRTPGTNEEYVERKSNREEWKRKAEENLEHSNHNYTRGSG